MKKSIFFLMALLLFLNPLGMTYWNRNIETYALEWPSEVSVSAEGAILMDADSGAVLYGKNIHTKFFPASITKILTALVIVENCDLNEELTFSYSAIHDVEENSSNAGFVVGDTITVRDALYALLLKSANESANALAEHCSGSLEGFVKLMNEKAESLGCKNSSFRNPSGLNNENHYVTAYDYALISKAAFENPLFLEIDSTTFYNLPKTKNYPEGQTIYSHHAMLKRSNQLHYPGIFGGKTGYTTLAGNTLVTGAERDGLRLITVVLNSRKTHYQDTKAMLDFGFSNFKNVEIEELDPDFLSVLEDIDVVRNRNHVLTMEQGRSVTLPKDIQMFDIDRKISYELEEQDPKEAIAKVSYSFDDRVVGTTYLLSNLAFNEKHTTSNMEADSKDNTITSNLNTSKASVEERIYPSQGETTSDLSEGTVQINEETSVSEATSDSFVQDEKSDIMDMVEKHLYIVYVFATLLIMAVLIMLLKLILYIRDRIVIRRKRRRRDAKRKANFADEKYDKQ